MSNKRRRRKRLSRHDIRELHALIEEQRKENNNFQQREIVTPAKRRPYDEIENVKTRSIFILHNCSIAAPEIARLLKLSERTIWYEIKRGFAILET